MDKLDIGKIKLSDDIVEILNKEKYSHKYRDIKSLEKNRKIQVKFIGEKDTYKDEEYAVFEVYYKLRNKITLFKQNDIELNYKKINRIYVKWNELF